MCLQKKLKQILTKKTMIIFQRLHFFLILIILGQSVRAVEPIRPVTSAYMIEAGSAHIHSSYLSPLQLGGWQTALVYQRTQAMRFNPERWIMELGGRLEGGRVRPEWRNSLVWDLSLNLSWGMLWRYNVSERWQLLAGGYTDITAGALYAQANSNNPVSAKASWTIGPRIGARWQGKLGRIPLSLAYRGDLPLTGCFFSPEYGELYYEIYLGNHKNLVHGAWPGNFFRLRNLVSADFRFGGTTLRVGYRLDVESTKANNLVHNSLTHMAVFGIVSEWISLAPGRRVNADAKIIY